MGAAFGVVAAASFIARIIALGPTLLTFGILRFGLEHTAALPGVESSRVRGRAGNGRPVERNQVSQVGGVRPTAARSALVRCHEQETLMAFRARTDRKD